MVKFTMPDKEASPQISVAVGITVSLVASLFQSFGLTIQRKSHIQNESLPVAKRKSDWRRPLWLIGFGIFITSNILSTVFQLSALPIVILAPLGAVSLIYNAFCARLILGDVFSRYLAIGTLFVAGGAVIVALFGVVPEPSHTLPQLIALYNRPPFLVWISIFSLFVLCLLLISHFSEYSLRSKTVDLEAALLSSDPTSQAIHKQLLLRKASLRVAGPRDHKRYHSLDSSRILPPLPFPVIQNGVESNATIVEKRKAVERLQFLVGAGYGAASGCLSGLCLLFAKTGVELLIQSIAGSENHFKHPQPWIIVAVLIIAAVAQLYYLNRALTFGGPTFVCPLAFMFYNLSSIISGLFFYDEWRLLSSSHIALVFVGTVVLLGGVWIVSLQGPDVKREAKESVTPTEETALLPPTRPHRGSNLTDTSSSSSDNEMDEGAMKTSSSHLLARGFSIGIGASSPGFAIRPSAHHVRPLPSRPKKSATYGCFPNSNSSSAVREYNFQQQRENLDGRQQYHQLEEETEGDGNNLRTIVPIMGPPLERTVGESDSELGELERQKRTVGRHRSLAGDPYVGFRRLSVSSHHGPEMKGKSPGQNVLEEEENSTSA